MRVVRSFAFLDLCGFTGYTAEHGDEAATAALAILRSATRTASERRGLRLVKWLGDGVMLSSIESPPLVAGCLEIIEQLDNHGHLPLRAGACRGKTIMFEGDDYIGAPVNLASRMCDRAQAGQLLCAGIDRVPWWAEATPLEELPGAALGLDTPVPVTDLRLDPGPHPLRDPVCGLPLDPARAPEPPEEGQLFCSSVCRAYWISEQTGQPL